MSRIFLAGLVAIALLFVGSIAFLSWPVRSPGPPAAATAPTLAEADSPPAGSAQTAPEDMAAAPPAPESPRPVARSPQDLMPPPRRHALMAFRRQLSAGLADLQARVAKCTPAGQSRPGAGVSQASLMLSVESIEGGVRIVDAQPEAGGTMTEAEMACARNALRGHVIPASSAEPGRSWKLRFSPKAAM